MYAEYDMIRFLERNGYDVSYISGLDTATNGSLLRNQLSAREPRGVQGCLEGVV